MSVFGICNRRYVVYYDESKQFISNDGGISSIWTVFTTTSPQNAKYISIYLGEPDDVNNGDEFLFQLELGTTATTYAEYIPMFIGIDTTEDLFDDYMPLFDASDLSSYFTAINNLNSDLNFEIDTNTDGIADNWEDFTGEMINEDNSDGQYFYASANYSDRVVSYNYNGAYTAGDVFTFNIDIESNTEYQILAYQKDADGGYTRIQEHLEYDEDNLINLTIATTEVNASPEIVITIGLFSFTGSGAFIGTGEYITFRDMYIIDSTEYLGDFIKSDLDLFVDFYEYWEGDQKIADITDSTFQDNYIYYMTEEGDPLLDRLVVLPIIDNNDIEFIPVASQTYLDYILQYYYNVDYSTNVLFEYGDYIPLSNYIINPYVLDNFIPSSVFEADTTRDFIIDIFWDYQNSVNRFEWYEDFGVTTYNFTDFYSEYEYNVAETVHLTYATLITITGSGNMTVTIIEDDTFWENLDEGLDSISEDNDFIRPMIVIAILLVTIIGLSLLGADFKILLFIGILELLLFTLIGWIGAWISLLIGIILFILIILKFSNKGE
jgi:hypothetical protein